MANETKTPVNPNTTPAEKRDDAAENPQRHDQSNKDIETAEKAEADRIEAGANDTAETTAVDAKALSSVQDPERSIGDHYVQTFANTPENPAPAPRLKDVGDEGKVRMELTDSDHPDPANPKVTYVHPDMVGDYRRAGWRTPDA